MNQEAHIFQPGDLAGCNCVCSACKSHCGYAATGDDGNIVGVAFVDVQAKSSRVAAVGPVASSAPGAGRKVFSATCAYAEKLGLSTLVRGEEFVWNKRPCAEAFAKTALVTAICYIVKVSRKLTHANFFTQQPFVKILPVPLCISSICCSVSLGVVSALQVLMQVASSTRSFSLYASLGFQVMNAWRLPWL